MPRSNPAAASASGVTSVLSCDAVEQRACFAPADNFSGVPDHFLFMQAGETRRKHEIRDFIDRGLAVAETERAKATLVSPTTSYLST